MRAPGAVASPITTPRLVLRPLDAAPIRMLLAGDAAGAAAWLGAPLPEGFADSRARWLRRHLTLLERHPDRAGWCARLTLSRDGGEVLGHCGFHGPPEVVGRAEIGYAVFEPHRGRGVATEAARGLVTWAFGERAREVFASVSPDNAPSLAIVRALGFRQVGVQEDPIDGTELVFAVAPATYRAA